MGDVMGCNEKVTKPWLLVMTGDFYGIVHENQWGFGGLPGINFLGHFSAEFQGPRVMELPGTIFYAIFGFCFPLKNNPHQYKAYKIL